MFPDLLYRHPCHLSLSDPPSHFKFRAVWLAGWPISPVSLGGAVSVGALGALPGTPAPLAKPGDVLQAAVYSTLFSLF